MNRALLATLLFASSALVADEPKAGARLLKRPDVSANPQGQLGDWGLASLQAAQKEMVPVIRGATKITFYSLDPRQPPTEQTENDPKFFHGWRVLGSIDISTPKDLDFWQRHLVEGILPGSAVGAFYPQYGLRLHSPAAPFDIVACFETDQWRLKTSTLARSTLSRGAALDAAVRDELHRLFDAKKIPRDTTTLSTIKPK